MLFGGAFALPKPEPKELLVGPFEVLRMVPRIVPCPRVTGAPPLKGRLVEEPVGDNDRILNLLDRDLSPSGEYERGVLSDLSCVTGFLMEPLML